MHASTSAGMGVEIRLNTKVADVAKTMKEGGTGTISEQAVQPLTMPDKFEIGSHNAIGLAGLALLELA